MKHMVNNRNNELIYWVALADNPSIGSKTIIKLKKYFGTLKNVFLNNGIKELPKINIRDDIRLEIKNVILSFKPEDLRDKYKRLSITPISLECDSYPKLLREIPDPPAVLFTKGKIVDNDELGLAIVGSRRYSIYGKRVVQSIVHKLVREGITIVSGMALGIDTLAHKATLEAGGRTIGVLANGLDEIYPGSNRALAESILDRGGLLISEFPPGVPPYKYNFPLRNRIIAGISLGTLVVEAAQKSGTLLTAKAVIDYNRELFAVPGSIFSPTSEGANNLIKYGARLVTSTSDICENLNIESKVKHKKAQQMLPSCKEETIIVKYLHSEESIHIDQIVKKTKLDISTVSSKLIFMEMKGMVKNIGANNYVLL